MVEVADRTAVEQQAAAVAETGPIARLFRVTGTIHTGKLLDSDLGDVAHIMRVD